MEGEQKAEAVKEAQDGKPPTGGLPYPNIV